MHPWAAALRRHFPAQQPAALDAWVRGFYKRRALWKNPQQAFVEEEEHIKAALHFSAKRGLLAGRGSLAAAVFWGHGLRAVGADAAACLGLLNGFGDMVQDSARAPAGAAAGDSSTTMPNSEEQFDTFLRALVVRDEPQLNPALQELATTMLDEALGYAPPEATRPPTAAHMAEEEPELYAWRLRLALLRCAMPSKVDLRRLLTGSPHSWLVPALQLPEFELGLTRDPPLMPCTYTAHHLFTAMDVKAQPPAGYRAALRPAASMLTASVLDSLWACYYATGSEPCVARVAWVASRSLNHIAEKLGDQHGVARFLRALILSEDPIADVAQLCGDDEQAKLVMAAGTSACLSLIENCDADPAVWDILLKLSKGGDAEVQEACRLVAVVRAAEDVASVKKT